MRRLLLVPMLAALLAAGGCGRSEGGGTAAPATTGPQGAATYPLTLDQGTGTGAAAPAALVSLSLFVEAAGRDAVGVMWELLSTETQQRFGPTEAEFRRRHAAELEDGLGSFARRGANYQPLLAVETSPGFAVAAIAGARTAEGKSQFASYATALRREDGGWKLELGGAVLLVPLVPTEPIKAGSAPQVGVLATAPVPIEDGALWIDGRAVRSGVVGPDPRHVAIAGSPSRSFQRGPHVGVAYARAGYDAAAVAWTFDAG